MNDRPRRNLLTLMGTMAITGCGAAEPANRSVSTVVINYTGRYIGDVFVNGVWVGAADAYSGEGNRVEGLLAPSDTSKTAVLKVKWIVADDYDIAENKYRRRPDEPHEAIVQLIGPHPANPSYLILHFYPDGRTEAELTADHPKRRIAPPPGYHR